MNTGNSQLDAILALVINALQKDQDRPPKLKDRHLMLLMQRDTILTLLQEALDCPDPDGVTMQALFFLFMVGCSGYQVVWEERKVRDPSGHVRLEIQKLLSQYMDSADHNGFNLVRMGELMALLDEAGMALDENFMVQFEAWISNGSESAVNRPAPDIVGLIAELTREFAEGNASLDADLIGMLSGSIGKANDAVIREFVQGLLAAELASLHQAVLLLLSHPLDRVRQIALDELERAIAAGHAMTCDTESRLTLLRYWVPEPVQRRIDAMMPILKLNQANSFSLGVKERGSQWKLDSTMVHCRPKTVACFCIFSSSGTPIGASSG